MKNVLTVSGILLSTVLIATNGLCDTKKGEKIDGKKAFEEHCAVCHPNGGNIVNAQKPLGRKALEASGIKSAGQIVATLRKPGPGMIKIDEKTISNAEAKAIAAYILKIFK